MSRIGSMVKKATQSVQQTANKASTEVKKQEAKAKKAAATVRDSFEGTSKLYDAGANKPGRTTRESKLTLGVDSKFGDSKNSDHLVSGLQARGFTQVANTVASAGADVFVGGKQTTVSTDDFTGVRRESTIKIGAEAGAQGFVGTVNGIKAGVQAGIEINERTTERSELGNGLQLKNDATINGFWGAKGKVGAQVGTVTGAGVEAFVGARGLGESRWAITDGTTGRGAVAGRFGAGVGVGVLAHVEGGVDVDNRQARVSGDVGAYLGVGAQVGGDVTIGGRDE